jgi:hypothetical protein
VILAQARALWLHNAAIHLQAVKLEGGQRPPSQLHFKEPNCDGFLKCRA